MVTSPSVGRQRHPGWLLRALGAMAIGGFLVSLYFLISSGPALKTELVAATDHSPPFQIVHPDGRISGAVVDALNLSAEHAGIRIRWVHMEVRPDAVLADPGSGVDLWPMVTATPERGKIFYTTQPIGRAEYLIAAIDDGHIQLAHYQPRSVAITEGSWLRRKLSSDFPDTEAVIVKSGQQLAALCEGRADALIADAASLYQMALRLPVSCTGKRLVNRLLTNWYWDLAIGSTFARRAEADRIRTEFGHLARNGALHQVFADYPIQAQYRSQDTFAETRTERDARMSRMTLIGLCICCLALLGILAETHRRTTQAMRLVKLKSDFLDRMSHELRTPLNGVLGLASLLATTSLSPQQRDYLRLIRQSGEELLRLVSDSLDLSRLTAQTRENLPEIFSPRVLIEDTVAVLAPLAEEKNLQLVWVVEREVPGQVLGDAVAVRQLLINLVGNALKYSPSGKVRVALRCTGIESGHPFLCFEVEDSGPGIPKEDRARIFESFVRLDRRQDRNTVGTGLGLAIARELVLLLNGRIGVGESSYGGARFWFEFPAELATPSATLDDHRVAPRVPAPVGEPVAPALRSGLAADAARDEDAHRKATPDADPVAQPWQPRMAHLVLLCPDDEVNFSADGMARTHDAASDCRGDPVGEGDAHPGTAPHRESASLPPTGLHSLALATASFARDSRRKHGETRMGSGDAPRVDADQAPLSVYGMRLSESLEMIAQHLEGGGTALRVSRGLPDALQQARRHPDTDLLVMEGNAHGRPLRTMIAAFREAYRQPFLPVVSICPPSCSGETCDGFRAPLMRIIRRPILTTWLQHALAELQDERSHFEDKTEQAAQLMAKKVPCAESLCRSHLDLPSRVTLVSREPVAPASGAAPQTAEGNATQPQPDSTQPQRSESASPVMDTMAVAMTDHVDAPKKRALVADDNPVNQVVLVAMLRSLGVESDVVADGEEALSACQTSRYHYIILDHHMPNLDGLDATRALRAKADWRGTVPIIASSAATLSLNEDRYRAAGVNAFLPKPFTLRQLRETLERASIISSGSDSDQQRGYSAHVHEWPTGKVPMRP